jgi:hypothetical protein
MVDTHPTRFLTARETNAIAGLEESCGNRTPAGTILWTPAKCRPALVSAKVGAVATRTRAIMTACIAVGFLGEIEFTAATTAKSPLDGINSLAIAGTFM